MIQVGDIRLIPQGFSLIRVSEGYFQTCDLCGLFREPQLVMRGALRVEADTAVIFLEPVKNLLGAEHPLEWIVCVSGRAVFLSASTVERLQNPCP